MGGLERGLALLVNTSIPCVVFEDAHLLVVNKPAGLNTHSPAEYAGEGIYDWLRNREPRWSRLAILHRLDKETSGIMVFGKSPQANRSVTRQFTDHSVHKKYLFFTSLRVKSVESSIVSAIVRAGDRYVARPPHKGSKTAETRFRIVRSTPNGTLIEAIPLSGRTHQIRVHAAAQGLPVLGDSLYGGEAAERLYLHAESLSLEHPLTGERLTFSAEPAFEFDIELALRSALIDPDETRAYRLIHGASDRWPDFYLDRVEDYLLCQSTEAAPGKSQRAKISKIMESLTLLGVYHRRLDRGIQKSSLENASPKLLTGNPAPNSFEIRENGLRFLASFEEGYSIGLFLDQRDNRRRILTNHVASGFPLFEDLSANPDVLNVFAYTCSFSVCAAKAGARVTSLDLSKKYLEWGRRNFRANGVDPGAHDFIYGDAFDWMRRLGKKDRRYDFIILDPPTFSRSKQSGTFHVESDYPKLMRFASLLLKPKGVILASSNAAGWKPALFSEAVCRSLQECGRKIVKQHFAPQPPDFPISAEEPGYLKTLWVKVGNDR